MPSSNYPLQGDVAHSWRMLAFLAVAGLRTVGLARRGPHPSKRATPPGSQAYGQCAQSERLCVPVAFILLPSFRLFLLRTAGANAFVLRCSCPAGVPSEHLSLREGVEDLMGRPQRECGMHACVYVVCSMMNLLHDRVRTSGTECSDLGHLTANHYHSMPHITF